MSSQLRWRDLKGDSMTMPEFRDQDIYSWGQSQDDIISSTPITTGPQRDGGYSVGNLDVSPEFPWRGLQIDLSLSMQDYSITSMPMSLAEEKDEDVYSWDFVTADSTLSTSAPTDSPAEPTDRPVETFAEEEPAVKHSALVQFEMITMTRAMNDFEIFGIFEPTCARFLSAQENYQLSNVGCNVTQQQLLSELSESYTRRLEKSASLVVDINVTCDGSSDIEWDSIISDDIAENSDVFVNVLKSKGKVAGIGTFDKLYSVNAVQKTNQLDAINSDSNAISEGEQSNGPLIIIVTIGVVLVVAIAVKVIQKRKHAPRKKKTPLPTRTRNSLDRVISPKPQKDAPVHAFPNIAAEVITENSPYRVTSPKPKRDRGNSPERVTNSKCPSSFVSDVESPRSTKEKHSTVIVSPTTRRQIVSRERHVVAAPSGKLGIITENGAQGVVVHSLKDDSPMKGLLFPGDLIEALDELDISNLSSASLTELMISRSEQERKIAVLRKSK